MKPALLLAGLLLCALGSGGVEAPRAEASLNYWLTSTRRWRGTIGQQPVTLQLDSGRFGYGGAYVYDRLGRALDLQPGPQPNPPGQPTAFEEWASDKCGVTGRLQFSGRVGPAITGTWRRPDGRRQVPLVLRENYRDAARYELETWKLRCHLPGPPAPWPAGSWTVYEQSYLRVHLPGNPAAEQRLQRVLERPGAPAAMKNRLQAALLGKPGGYLHEESLYVLCNTNNLLSVASWHQELDPVAGYWDEWTDVRNFDLRTGRQLQLPDLLRPGYRAGLRQLLLEKLAAVWKNESYGRVGAGGQLPRSGFSILPTGLGFSYDQRDDQRLVRLGPLRTGRQFGVELSYQELLPLIRPDGPLAAMLRERGLTPAAAPAKVPAHPAGK